MVFAFLYGNINNVDIIKKIDATSEYYGGYVIVNKYDKENNLVEISKNEGHNNTLLHGKIVKFNMDINQLTEKITGNEEYRFKKTRVDTIWASTIKGDNVRIVYILY
jgi:hypothetical protein